MWQFKRNLIYWAAVNLKLYTEMGLGLENQKNKFHVWSGWGDLTESEINKSLFIGGRCFIFLHHISDTGTVTVNGYKLLVNRMSIFHLHGGTYE